MAALNSTAGKPLSNVDGVRAELESCRPYAEKTIAAIAFLCGQAGFPHAAAVPLSLIFQFAQIVPKALTGMN